MGILDAPLRAVTSKVVGLLGGKAILTKTVIGYVPSQDIEVQEGQTVYSNLSIIPPTADDIQETKGDAVVEQSFQVGIAASDLPEIPVMDTGVTWILTWQGKDYRVLQCDPIWSGDQAVLYTLTCRK